VGSHAGENYLSQVPKERVLSVASEAVSLEKTDAMRRLKKDQLVMRADEKLSFALVAG
jgi:hypothetical protein